MCSLVPHFKWSSTFNNGCSHWRISYCISLLCNFYNIILGFNFRLCFLEFISMKGSTIWFLQRSSAIVNLFYVSYMFFFFISSSSITFDLWVSFFYSNLTIFLTILFVASVLIHSFIGLWTVGTDYLTKRTIGFLSFRISKYADLFRSAYTVVFFTFGLSYLVGSLLIILVNS